MASNYPDGLSDWSPEAPWNEPYIPEKEFEITCSQTLSKTVSVWTDNYTPGASGVDYEPDDEGGYYSSAWQDSDDTSDTNWTDVYNENEHRTPLQLICTLKKVLEENLKQGIVYCNPYVTDLLIKECDDWVEDDISFCQD